MNANPTQKNPLIQAVDFGIIQINKALKDLYACRNSVNVETTIRDMKRRLVELQKERKSLRKAEFRQRNIQKRLNDLYGTLASVTRENKGPRSKAVQNINTQILELISKL